MRTGLTVLASVVVLLLAPASGATQFSQGALVIPMDTDYQDSGMLKAFGLLNQLLLADVPVHWVIASPKQIGDADFTVSAKDFATGAAIASHGYRGGPFVVDAAHAAKAGPVIAAWQAGNVTTVHVADQGFTGRTGRLLTAAPTIAVIDDGNADIAFKYLNAAAIPDRLGNVWTTSSPDVHDVAAVAGPTTTAHNDGILFRPSGQPAYCQIMTMHWDVKKVVDEVVAEYREFLQFPTHMMAECQAVNAVENNVYGKFLTTTGFVIDNNVKDTGPFEYLNLETPFVQMDGAYQLVGGSERAYTLAAGGKYHDTGVVMIKDAATTLGVRSVWMTGYIDGKCTIGGDEVIGGVTCTSGVGKVSYLGGHSYDVKLPISSNPSTQGARLFLNSLFEAGCATEAGQPVITLTKTGPSWTTTGTVTYTLSYANTGPGPALGLKLGDTLPAGASYVSSTGGGTASGQTVTWDIGDLASGATGSVQLTVSFGSHGVYTNQLDGSFTVGLSTKTVLSNVVSTSYQASAPDAGLDAGAPLEAGVVDAGAPEAGPLEGGAAFDAIATPDLASGVDAAAGDAAGDTGGAGDGPPADGPAAGDAALADSGPGDGPAVADGPGPGSDGAAADGSSLADAGPDGGSLAEPTGGGGGDGGCDCRLSGTGSGPGAAWLLLLVALAVVRRRR